MYACNKKFKYIRNISLCLQFHLQNRLLAPKQMDSVGAAERISLITFFCFLCLLFWLYLASSLCLCLCRRRCSYLLLHFSEILLLRCCGLALFLPIRIASTSEHTLSIQSPHIRPCPATDTEGANRTRFTLPASVCPPRAAFFRSSVTWDCSWLLAALLPLRVHVERAC